VTRCKRCRRLLADDDETCRLCGTPNPSVKGMYQTSTVLISAGGADLVYRSVDEVPVALRTRLIESTSGDNARTILIYDERGRQEIAKAMRNLPAPAPRGLLDSALARLTPACSWLTPLRLRLILGLIVTMSFATLALEIAQHWH
jgi:hypothetical protein